jgi:formate/nitrite transporter FocA (FNT family)
MSSFIVLAGVSLVTLYFLFLAVKTSAKKPGNLKRESRKAYLHCALGGILGAFFLNVVFLVFAKFNDLLDDPSVFMSCFFYGWFGLVGGSILGLLVCKRST